jgi:hypothetical protein
VPGAGMEMQVGGRTGGCTSDKMQPVNTRGEFEPISLRRCNPDGTCCAASTR